MAPEDAVGGLMEGCSCCCWAGRLGCWPLEKEAEEEDKCSELSPKISRISVSEQNIKKCDSVSPPKWTAFILGTSTCATSS